MIDKTNMQGVINVIRQAEMANSRAADASLGISNEQQQSRFASDLLAACLLYTSPSPRDMRRSRMPSSA